MTAALALTLLPAVPVVGAEDAARGKPAATSTKKTPAAPGKAAATPADLAPAPAITYERLEALVATLAPAQREALLAEDDALRKVLDEEAALAAVLKAAEANGARDDAATRLLMERASQRVLADLYLARVVRANLAPDFPSDEDVREGWERNRDRFSLPERVHLWQVYLPLSEDMDTRAREAVATRAKALAKTLKQGKQRFEQVAAESSAHAPSRLAGGYMGLLNVPELLPEVREAVAALEEGAVSEPIQTAQGWHIVRRGARLPKRELPFEEVREQVRESLLREASARVRAAAVEKIRDEYPSPWPETELGAWRERLRARDWSAPLTAAPAGEKAAPKR